MSVLSASSAAIAACLFGLFGTACPIAQAQSPAKHAQAAASQSLPPASLHGARIFIKYSLQYYPAAKTSMDHLILFPSGAAFTDLPTKPVSQFDEATLRANLKHWDIGTWKQVGNILVLDFPEKSSDKKVTLHKVSKGWYEGKGQPKPDAAYDIYYPVISLSPKTLTGPWANKTLVTMGTTGGTAAMVAAGSTGNRVFYADGTYSDARDSFTSATTQNMDEVYKGSGGDTTTTTKRKTGMAGLWRIDGPLMTLQNGNERVVCVAFAMPYWGDAKKPDLLLDGDRWTRPKK